jgi:hypothetical protein
MSKRVISVLRAATVTVAAGALCAAGVAALPAIAHADSSAGTLVDSAQLSTPIAAQGVLDDAAGNPASAGTVVFLQALPTSSQDGALTAGDSITTTSLGYAYTDAEGNFTLRYSDPTTLAQYADDAGNLNMEVLSADGFSIEDITRTLPSAATTPALAKRLAAVNGLRPAASSTYPRLVVHPLPGAAQAAKAHPVKVRYAQPLDDPTDTSSPTDTPTPDPTDDSPVVDTTADPTDTAVPLPGEKDPQANPDKGFSCRTSVYKNIGNRYVTVGEGYSNGVASATFSYRIDSTTSVGVGVSLSGAKGSFSASGTTAVTNSKQEDFTPVTSGGARFETLFYYKILVHVCSGQTAHYNAVPTSYTGGAANVSSSTPSATKCAPQSKGSKFTDNSTHAVTFSSGASVGGDIGINLSTETGFTKNASIVLYFDKAAGHACGTHNYPGGDPQRLVAKS